MDDQVNKIDWPKIQREWSYAYGKPLSQGVVKQSAEDFVVEELMNVTPSGEGEHVWLHISKVRQNTESVAKALARFCEISYRDVSYSGLKDFQAHTHQWFSVRLPIKRIIDWSAFQMIGVVINNAVRHHRKLKRATHLGNRFELVIRDLQANQSDLEQRLQAIKSRGVPNYYGSQRFGRDASNLAQACDMFAGTKKVKSKHLRSLLISSARSWLFNVVLSSRIENDRWETLQPNEPANLDGSSSLFTAEGSLKEIGRLAALDIHPTAPLWGDSARANVKEFADLHAWECQQMGTYPILMSGLLAIRASYQRRALRMKVKDFRWNQSGRELHLNFVLGKGGYATSVLRELINDQGVR